jgi:large subunit ribosomal protein L10
LKSSLFFVTIAGQRQEANKLSPPETKNIFFILVVLTGLFFYMTPKATIKQVKKDEVKKLSELIGSAASVSFVDYTGMDMKSQQGLQNSLKESGSKMLVAKNTLLQIAAKEAGLPEDATTDTVLSGQTAVVISGADAVSPIQIIGKQIKLSEKPKFKAGVIDGVYYDANGLMKVSSLPSKEVLVSKVIGAVAGPLYGLVGVLNGNLNALVWALSARRDQLAK